METIEALAATVVRIAREFSADAILTSTETGRTFHLIRGMTRLPKPRVIAATLNPGTREELRSGGFAAVMMSKIASRVAQIQCAIGRALAEGMVRPGEVLVCMIGERPGADADTIFVHRITGSESRVAGLTIPSPVVGAVVELAVQLGREGVNGRSVGAAFIVGDEGKVMEISSQIGINPFKGYSLSLPDRKNWELVKKYALAFEGAFVVGRDGLILAGDRYLRAEGAEADIPCGLGTRHRAAARITAATGAIGVVVSEGDRGVRIFQGGRLVGTIDPLSGTWTGV